MPSGSIDGICCDSCSICTGEHVKLFLPITQSGLIEFIQLEDGLHSLAVDDALIDLVWKNEHWTDKIFKNEGLWDKEVSSRSNVFALDCGTNDIGCDE